MPAGKILHKIKKNIDNPDHSLHDNVIENQSVFDHKLLQIRCDTDCYRKSFLPTAITFYNNCIIWINKIQQHFIFFWDQWSIFESKWICLNKYSTDVIFQEICKKENAFYFKTQLLTSFLKSCKPSSNILLDFSNQFLWLTV